MDQPVRLLVALYVRDVLGITQTAAPVGLPRIDPASGIPAEGVPSELATYTGAWNRWWTRCLAAYDDGTVEVMSRAFVSDAHLAEQIGRLSGPAITWSQAHRDAARGGIHKQAMLQGSVIRAHLSTRAPILPFTLQLLVLPVDSSEVWPVGPELVIVSDRVFTADGAFGTVVLDLIETLLGPP